MMDQRTIEKINELKNLLAEAAKLWRANYRVEIYAELYLKEKDTSSVADINYIAGTVTQVVRPRLMVTYWISQDEHTEYNLIEMPGIPSPRLECTAMDIDFHILALKRILLDYPPTKEDWMEAEEKYADRFEKVKKEADEQPF